jgi:hypothetical protein
MVISAALGLQVRVCEELLEMPSGLPFINHGDEAVADCDGTWRRHLGTSQ